VVQYQYHDLFKLFWEGEVIPSVWTCIVSNWICQVLQVLPEMDGASAFDLRDYKWCVTKIYVSCIENSQNIIIFYL